MNLSSLDSILMVLWWWKIGNPFLINQTDVQKNPKKLKTKTNILWDRTRFSPMTNLGIRQKCKKQNPLRIGKNKKLEKEKENHQSEKDLNSDTRKKTDFSLFLFFQERIELSKWYEREKVILRISSPKFKRKRKRRRRFVLWKLWERVGTGGRDSAGQIHARHFFADMAGRFFWPFASVFLLLSLSTSSLSLSSSSSSQISTPPNSNTDTEFCVFIFIFLKKNYIIHIKLIFLKKEKIYICVTTIFILVICCVVKIRRKKSKNTVSWKKNFPFKL